MSRSTLVASNRSVGALPNAPGQRDFAEPTALTTSKFEPKKI